MAIDLDPAFHALGVWGLWQLSQIFMIKAAFFPAGVHLISIVFVGYEPPFHCNPPSNYSEPISICTDDGNSTMVLEQCKIYDTRTNESLPCQNGYTYDYNGTTIVTEWDLVCDKDYVPSLAQTLMIAGQAVGAVFFTGLADKFGRRPIFIWSHAFYFILNVGMAFVPNVELLIFLRFLSGFFQQGLVMMTAVLTLELLPMGHRSVLTLISSIMWGSTMASLTLFGYFFRDQTWRHMQLALCLTSIVGLVDLIFVNESVRWLCINNRLTEAIKILTTAAKINRKKIDDVLSPIRKQMPTETWPTIMVPSNTGSELRPSAKDENGTSENSTNEKVGKYLESRVDQHVLTDVISASTSEPHTVDTGQYSMFDIFRHPVLRRTTLIMAYIWVVNSFVYFGLIMLSDTLPGNRFITFLIGGAVEIPAGIIAYLGVKRFGRKPSLYVFQGTAGVALLLGVILQVFAGPSADAGMTALSLIGKSSITASFNVVFMYTPELYPTNLRSFGAGFASSISRIGGTLAPFTRLLMETLPWLPGTLFGVLALTGGLLVKLLTETRDLELPQNIEEMNAWQKVKQTETK